jgi:hypothetical protein
MLNMTGVKSSVYDKKLIGKWDENIILLGDSVLRIISIK